jgi:hypothetical protein
MKKKYLKLTKEQKERGVAFSSEIDGVRHEITDKEYYDNPVEAEEKEARLRDDSFFRGWGKDENGEMIHEIRTK